MSEDKSTQQWFTDLLKKYENDPDFQKEGIIFELQEKIAIKDKQITKLRLRLKKLESEPKYSFPGNRSR
jgi:hypothetical protein